MSQTVQQMNEISRTLQQGLGMAAGDRLQRRQMDLQAAQQDYTLKAAERDYNDPTKVLARQTAQTELDRGGAPVGFTDFFPDQYAQLHGVYQPKDGRPALYNRVEGLFGGKFDTKSGHLLKADGTPLTRREMEARLPEVSSLIAMELDPDRHVSDEQDRTIDKIDAGQGDPQEHAKRLQAIDTYWKDPSKRLSAYQRKLEFLQRQSGPEAQKLTKKTEEKIEALRKEMQPKDASWSQPFEAAGPDGRPVLLRQNSKTGAIQLVNGYGPKTAKGMRVEADGQGGFTLVTNADQTIENSALTKPNVNKQQENLLGLQDQAARLAEIERMYNPSFLTAEGRFKDAVLTGKDFLQMGMSPEEREFYTKRNEFMTGAYRQINQYIKDITGAALSEAEAKRIMAGAPNPNDPPARYAAKLRATVRDVKMGMVRSRYALTKGLALEDISIDRMPAIIDRRGDEIEQELLRQTPQATPQQISTQVRQQLKSEFGMEI